MSLFKSTGFNLAGKVYENGENLCDEDFPSEDHISICIEKGHIVKVSDAEVEEAEVEEVEDKEFEGEPTEDIYDSMEKDELIEELVSLGEDAESLTSKQAKTLRKMLREKA